MSMKPDQVQALHSPPGKFQSVYITSKRIYAPMLLELRKDWPTLYFTARWAVTRDIPSEQSKPANLWLRDNVDDIMRSEFVICYAQKDDVLVANSIWECGFAWAHGKPIYLVGENSAFKEWRSADRTWHYETLAGAFVHIINRTKYGQSSEDRVMQAFQHSVDRIAHLVQEGMAKKSP